MKTSITPHVLVSDKHKGAEAKGNFGGECWLPPYRVTIVNVDMVG
jgi:hypothetical protein